MLQREYMKSEIKTEDYTVRYIKEEDKIVIRGNLRLVTVEKYDEIIDFILYHTMEESNAAILDLTKLEALNSSGIAALGMFIIKMKDNNRFIKITGSRYISWQVISLENFKDIHKNIEIEFMVQH